MDAGQSEIPWMRVKGWFGSDTNNISDDICIADKETEFKSFIIISFNLWCQVHQELARSGKLRKLKNTQTQQHSLMEKLKYRVNASNSHVRLYICQLLFIFWHT